MLLVLNFLFTIFVVLQNCQLQEELHSIGSSRRGKTGKKKKKTLLKVLKFVGKLKKEKVWY